MDDNITGIRLGLSFNIRRGRMLIYHSTIRAMGEPEYIRFLFNNRDKKIAVQRCEAIDRDSFRVPKVVPGERFQFDITSSPFLSEVPRPQTLPSAMSPENGGCVHSPSAGTTSWWLINTSERSEDCPCQQ